MNQFRVIMLGVLLSALAPTQPSASMKGSTQRVSSPAAAQQSICDQLVFSVNKYRTEVPTALVSGDWDKNGTIDLAQSAAFPGGYTPVQMLLNDGTGSFTYSLSGPCFFPYSSINFDIVAGDFDNDDTLDVVLPHVGTAYPAPNAVRVMRGTSRFGCIFEFINVSATGTDFPECIAAGHFNNDALLDVAVGGLHSNTVGVLLGTGPNMSYPINFGPPLNFPAGAAPRDIATADFNDDGKDDLAVAASGEGSVKVFLGVGDGTFVQPAFSTAVGDSPVAIVPAFLNSDAHMDLAVANYNSGSVSVLLGQGNGLFSEAPGSPVSVGTGPTAISAADIYNHGRKDLAVVNRINGTLTVLLNGSGGDFSLGPPCDFGLPVGPSSITTADYDGDGKADLAVGSYDDFGGDDTVTVFLNRTTVAVDHEAGFAQGLHLAQSRPNPFTDVTVVSFTLPEGGDVVGDIYDVAGHRVRRFAKGPLPAGAHTYTWNGRDADGRPLSSGIYFYRIQWRGVTMSRRAVLIR